MSRRTTAVRPLTTALAAAASLLLGACWASRGAAPPSPRGAPPSVDGGAVVERADGRAVVERVVDGDTIIVDIAKRRERVRLIGIDTPESVKPNTPVQCFALEASARTKTLLPKDTPVRLVRDVDLRDRYGRLLAYVYRQPDDLFVNLSLVRDGFASVYTFPPNVAHTGDFVAAAADARAAGRGLWSRCPLK